MWGFRECSARSRGSLGSLWVRPSGRLRKACKRANYLYRGSPLRLRIRHTAALNSDIRSPALFRAFSFTMFHQRWVWGSHCNKGRRDMRRVCLRTREHLAFTRHLPSPSIPGCPWKPRCIPGCRHSQVNKPPGSLGRSLSASLGGQVATSGICLQALWSMGKLFSCIKASRSSKAGTTLWT